MNNQTIAKKRSLGKVRVAPKTKCPSGEFLNHVNQL